MRIPAQRLKDSQTLTEALEERERAASADRSKHLEQVNELSGLLHEANEDPAQRLKDIQTLTGELRRLQLERERDSGAAHISESHRESFWKRAALRLRRRTRPDRPLVAIDVTPILPGSENGGVKALVTRTSERLRQKGTAQVRALTTPSNYATFSGFEEQGVVRLCTRSEWSLSGRREGPPLATYRPLGVGNATRPRRDLLFCPITI